MIDLYVIAGAVAVVLIVFGVLFWRAQSGAGSKRGEKEREADLDEANEGIRRRARVLSLRELARRLRKAAGG